MDEMKLKSMKKLINKMTSLLNKTYECSEDVSNFAIIDNEGKSAIEILHDLICRVRSTITKCLISFNHKHGLVRLLYTILFIQGTQIPQAPQENTVYVIHPTKQPANII